jgi:hypothetical protein
MGIRLDWEIEAEQSHIRRAGEDPDTARRRRRARLRLLAFLLALVGIFAGVAGLIVWRLEAVEAEIERQLRNTVDAEIAALRLGDWQAFAVAQRSAAPDWLIIQEQAFNEYQRLKQENDVQLTGRILDAVIDRQRGRVAVEEIINAVSYTRVWFYWRYDDGWRHVPPDYTFWGEVERYDSAGVSLRYRSVDAPLAAQMGPMLAAWLKLGCGALVCGTLPPLNIEILPDEALQVSWSAADPWLLQVPSPYLKRARTDQPFDQALQFTTAGLLAERLVSAAAATQPVYPADAYYLRQAIISWLVGRFVEWNTNSFLVASLATNYGDSAVGRLLQIMQPDSDARLLAAVTGVGFEAAALDWRDYLTWRLTVEADLIRRRDEVNFLALYDTRDMAVRDLASQRFAALPPDLSRTVISAPLEIGEDGIPLLRAVVQTGQGESAAWEDVLFRLSDGLWRRAS